jgi:four helix bundle protein
MDLEVRKNINRGYRQLIVWQDAIAFYVLTSRVFGQGPYLLRRVASQQIASVDSIHRNVAEGYCRRSLKEYLQFLNIALASAGESVSGLHAFRSANQITEAEFETLDAAAWKLENGLKRLIESLQRKATEGDWETSFVKEPEAEYDAPQYSTQAPEWWLEMGLIAPTGSSEGSSYV